MFEGAYNSAGFYLNYLIVFNLKGFKAGSNTLTQTLLGCCF